jgi:hypothetical protein
VSDAQQAPLAAIQPVAIEWPEDSEPMNKLFVDAVTIVKRCDASAP